MLPGDFPRSSAAAFHQNRPLSEDGSDRVLLLLIAITISYYLYHTLKATGSANCTEWTKTILTYGNFPMNCNFFV